MRSPNKRRKNPKLLDYLINKRISPFKNTQRLVRVQFQCAREAGVLFITAGNVSKPQLLGFEQVFEIVDDAPEYYTVIRPLKSVKSLKKTASSKTDAERSDDEVENSSKPHALKAAAAGADTRQSNKYSVPKVFLVC